MAKHLINQLAIALMALGGFSCSSVQTIRGRIVARDPVSLICLNGFVHYRLLAKTPDGRYVRFVGSQRCEEPLPTDFFSAERPFRVRREPPCDQIIRAAHPWRKVERPNEDVV